MTRPAPDPVLALRAALIGRENHASLIGLTTAPMTDNRVLVSWHDYAHSESAPLLYEAAGRLDRIKLLLVELRRWREAATAPRSRKAAA